MPDPDRRPPRETPAPRAWARTGAWTVADQALFAGANFVVSVLLARWLTPEGYGAYTVAFTVFLLLGALHSGFLVEPMMVFGSGRFERRLRPYLRVLLRGHGRLSVVFGAVLLAVAAGAWAAGQATLALAAAAFAVGQAAILFQWTMRSACFIRTQPVLATVSDGLYFVLVVGGVAALQRTGTLGVVSAVGLLAGASLVAGGLTAARLGIPRRFPEAGGLADDAYGAHRSYGTWAAATGGLEWVNGFLPFLLLPLWAGLAETGALRALFNLVMPVLHVAAAVTKLALPILVRTRPDRAQRRLALQIGGGLMAGAVAWAGLIVAVGAEAFSLLYDGNFDAWAHLLWVVAVIPAVVVVAVVAMAVLRARERPEAVFSARLAASAWTVTGGAALTFVLGALGALLAEVGMLAIESASMLWSLRKGRDEAPPALPTPGGDGASARRRVLMVAFACAPGRGSEPGVGWQIATGVAARHDVTALVYRGFHDAVEAELARHPVPGLAVVYYKLPWERRRHWRDGRDRRGLGEQVHYHLWQIGAGGLARRLHRSTRADLTHHVSLGRYWSPSAAAVHGVPFLWGPVGGGESAPPALVAALPAGGRRFERARDAARWVSTRLPSTRWTAHVASLALATTPETARALRQIHRGPVDVCPAVSLAPGTFARLGALSEGPRSPGPFRVVTVGRLVHWKGGAFAVRSFAAALASGAPALDGATLEFIGDGPARADLGRLADRLGVADRVRFSGRLARGDAHARLAAADVLLYPSLHDSGSYAVLEAMAARRPVVCLDLGGPGLLVTPETGAAVAAETPDQVVADLAGALVALAADPARRARLGDAARARVGRRFRRDALTEAVTAAYDRVLGPEPAPAGAAVPEVLV